MIIVAGGQGGSGKTTVATNLAILSATEGRDVLLIDADDQETATDFTVLRNEHHADVARYTQANGCYRAYRDPTPRAFS